MVEPGSYCLTGELMMDTNGNAAPAVREIRVVAGVNELSRTAAEAIVLRAADAIRDHGRFVVALSGGSTPRSLFQLLASPEYAARIDWTKVHVCWGDERCVPPEDSQSNYRMASDALLDHVAIPESNVHRMRGEDAPEVAAAAYEATLRELFDMPQQHQGDFPAFDLILLGLGADGHTASLFPDGAVLHERTRWVAADYGESVSMWRITLTLPLINAARHVLFLVAGDDKADMVQRILGAHHESELLPAARVAPVHGILHWLMDAAAAAKSTVTPTTSASFR